MTLSIRLSQVLRPTPRLNAVIVCAKKDRRSGDGFSWKRNRPRKKYSPRPSEMADISILYSKSVIVESTPDLVKGCNEHINDHVENRDLISAQEVFDLMIEKEVEPDAFTYTTLMKGYSQHGNTDRVCELFAEMEMKGVIPTVVTFNTAIRVYNIDGDLEGAQSFFKRMKDGDGPDPDVYTYNSMLSVCVAARDLETARRFFSEMNSPGVKQSDVTLNTMIDVYAECCNEENGRLYLEECIDLMEEMELLGVMANERTYSTLLKLCSRGNLTADAMKILNEMRDNGLRPNVFSYSTVLDGISKDHDLSKNEVLSLSSRLVNEMKRDRVRPDATTYCSLLNVALRVGDLYRAKSLFKELKILKVKPDSVTYATMTKCYEKLGNPEDGVAYLKPCLDLLEECEQAGMYLTVEGYISLLSACAKASDLDQALRIWNKITLNQRTLTVSTYNAMINVWIGAGDLYEAITLFNEMKTTGYRPDHVTYATMIKGHEKLGNPYDGDDYLRACLDLLEECEQAGIKMYIEGYISLLSACAKISNLDQALKIWNRMKEKKVKPIVSAFNAMINVCLSTERTDKAFDFFDQMKTSGIKPTIVTFRTFLSYFVKKKDRSGAQKIHDEMKILRVKPNRSISKMLKALEVE